MIKFFPEHTNWYKGNLHSHTTNSDGAWTPDEAVEHYKANGYAFLCLSDHNLYTDYRYKYNSDLFLILPGTEIAAVLFDEKDGYLKMHHLNGILGTKAMQEQAKSGLFQHMERIEPIVMVTGMEEKLQKQWRKISEIMDVLLHIIIQSGRASNLTSLR